MIVASVIPVNTAGSFDALIYPNQHVNNFGYLSNQFNVFAEKLGELGKEFIEKGKQAFDNFNKSQIAVQARALAKKATGIFKPDVVLSFNALEDFAAAQNTMQRYVMACPEIRELYHKQRCDGYSDTYVDMDKGKVGEAHYDYRRVMNGIVQFDSDDNWKSVEYLEDLREGDRDLDIGEQVDILNTWDIARIFINAGKDPTNISGGDL